VLPERLAGFGITLEQLGQTIQAANQELPAGYVEAANTNFSVYTGAFLRTAEEIGRLVVGSRGGVPIYVRDVATVTNGPEEARRMVAYYTGQAAPENEPPASGEAAVTVALAKKEGSNGVTVANDILAQLDLLKGHLIPENVRVSTTRDYQRQGKRAADRPVRGGGRGVHPVPDRARLPRRIRRHYRHSYRHSDHGVVGLGA